MTTSHHFPPDYCGSLENQVFRPQTLAEVIHAVEQAFDYRGDVTIELISGDKLEGYLFNRDVGGEHPFLELLCKDRPQPHRIAYRDVAVLAFTGRDTASGKSWEAWAAKKASQRQAEAEEAAAQARARGHL